MRPTDWEWCLENLDTLRASVMRVSLPLFDKVIDVLKKEANLKTTTRFVTTKEISENLKKYSKIKCPNCDEIEMVWNEKGGLLTGKRNGAWECKACGYKETE